MTMINDLRELGFDLQVHRPDGKVEHLIIRHTRVLIGLGAHCDIRIDGTGAAREHVELQLQGEKLVARSLSFTPPPIIAGVPLVSGVIEPGTQVAVCGTRVTVRLLRETPRERRNGRRAAGVAAALFAFVLPGVVWAALRPPVDATIGPPPEPTPLFDDALASCKFDAADQALHHAKQMRASGEGARERYPFAIGDGVLAVNAFATAAACYRVARQSDDAAKSSDSADALRIVVERDYHAHRVRLEHAIETDDLFAAVTEVRTLRSLTTGLKGPYFDWLAVVERRLELNLRSAPERKKP